MGTNFSRRTLALLAVVGLLAAADAAEPTHRLAWKLPKGSLREYLVTVTVDSRAPQPVGAALTFRVTLRAPRDGVALVDIPLDGMNAELRGEEVDPASVGARYEAHTVLREDGRFDPYQALGDVSRNLLASLFPLPEAPVAVGKEWPSTVGAMLSQQFQFNSEYSLGILKAIEDENGTRIAVLDLEAESSQLAPDVTVVGPGHESVSITGAATFDLARGHFRDHQLRAVLRTGPRAKANARHNVAFGCHVRLARSDTLAPAEIERLDQLLTLREAIGTSLELAHKGQVQEALAAIAKLVEAGPPDEHAPFYAARLHLDAGHPAEAEQAIEKELAQSPRYLPSLELAKRIYEKVGKADKAKAIDERLKPFALSGPFDAPEP